MSLTLTRRAIVIRLPCNVQSQAKQQNGAEDWGAEKPDNYDAQWWQPDGQQPDGHEYDAQRHDKYSAW